MQREPGEPPDPVDEFDQIVSGWRREKSVPAWPDEPDRPDRPDEPDESDRCDEPDRPDRPDRCDEPTRQCPTDDEPTGACATDEGHFTPPEPPPLPRLGPPGLVGLSLLALGLVLVTAPWWVGVPDVYGMPLGLLTLAMGLGWLVLRLWPDASPRGDGDGEDDGAVL